MIYQSVSLSNLSLELIECARYTLSSELSTWALSICSFGEDGKALNCCPLLIFEGMEWLFIVVRVCRYYHFRCNFISSASALIHFYFNLNEEAIIANLP